MKNLVPSRFNKDQIISRMFNKLFECCLVNALTPIIQIMDKDHLHNVSHHCSIYANKTFEAEEYLVTVYKFYISRKKKISIAECNTVCDKRMEGWYHLLAVFWLVALVFGLMGNILVIIAFGKTPALRKNVTNFFVTSLAVSDLLLVMFIMPIQLYNSLHNINFCGTIEVCQIYFTTDVMFFVASITNLFAVTVDRFIAITKPYKYNSIVTLKRAKISIACIWIYAAIWGVMVNYNKDTHSFDAIQTNHHKCFYNKNKDLFFTINFGLVFCIPSLIMLVLYAIILKISISHAKQIDENSYPRRGSKEFPISKHFFSSKKMEFRATKLVSIVYGTFLICWLPVTCLSLALVRGSIKQLPKWVNIVFGRMLPLINSTLNPFIYGLLHRDFKQSLQRLLGVTHLKKKQEFLFSRRSTFESARFSALSTFRSNIEMFSSPASERKASLNETLESNDNFSLQIPNMQIKRFSNASKTSSSDESTRTNEEIKPLVAKV